MLVSVGNACERVGVVVGGARIVASLPSSSGPHHLQVHALLPRATAAAAAAAAPARKGGKLAPVSASPPPMPATSWQEVHCGDASGSGSSSVLLPVARVGFAAAARTNRIFTFGGIARRSTLTQRSLGPQPLPLPTRAKAAASVEDADEAVFIDEVAYCSWRQHGNMRAATWRAWDSSSAAVKTAGGSWPCARACAAIVVFDERCSRRYTLAISGGIDAQGRALGDLHLCNLVSLLWSTPRLTGAPLRPRAAGSLLWGGSSDTPSSPLHASGLTHTLVIFGGAAAASESDGILNSSGGAGTQLSETCISCGVVTQTISCPTDPSLASPWHVTDHALADDSSGGIEEGDVAGAASGGVGAGLLALLRSGAAWRAPHPPRASMAAHALSPKCATRARGGAVRALLSASLRSAYGLPAHRSSSSSAASGGEAHIEAILDESVVILAAGGWSVRPSPAASVGGGRAAAADGRATLVRFLVGAPHSTVTGGGGRVAEGGISLLLLAPQSALTALAALSGTRAASKGRRQQQQQPSLAPVDMAVASTRRSGSAPPAARGAGEEEEEGAGAGLLQQRRSERQGQAAITAAGGGLDPLLAVRGGAGCKRGRSTAPTSLLGADEGEAGDEGAGVGEGDGNGLPRASGGAAAAPLGKRVRGACAARGGGHPLVEALQPHYAALQAAFSSSQRRGADTAGGVAGVVRSWLSSFGGVLEAAARDDEGGDAGAAPSQLLHLRHSALIDRLETAVAAVAEDRRGGGHGLVELSSSLRDIAVSVKALDAKVSKLDSSMLAAAGEDLRTQRSIGALSDSFSSHMGAIQGALKALEQRQSASDALINSGGGGARDREALLSERASLTVQLARALEEEKRARGEVDALRRASSELEVSSRAASKEVEALKAREAELSSSLLIERRIRTELEEKLRSAREAVK